MLLKVLMDFRSLQKETKYMHQHTYKQKRKLTMKAQNNKITIQQQGKTCGKVQLLRIKRQ